ATDRSPTADQAVRWAANLAAASAAELLLVQVLLPDGADESAVERAERELGRFAEELAGARGRARVVVDADPARAIVAAAEESRADVLVVGNVGMAGRKQFLLGNIPNQISHNARCSVVIVNTAHLEAVDPAPTRPALDGGAGGGRELLARAWRIGRVLAGAALPSGRRTDAPDADRSARAR